MKLERRQGAIAVDNLEIANMSTILDFSKSGQIVTLPAEFKISLNAYLSELLYSPVRSLHDVIAFNNKHIDAERLAEIDQSMLLVAQNTSGLGRLERSAIARMAELSQEGLEKLMEEERLDAIVTPDAAASSVFVIGGYPMISVPAGYGRVGVPFGLTVGGLRGSEPKLIGIAYAFEQATNAPPRN